VCVCVCVRACNHSLSGVEWCLSLIWGKSSTISSFLYFPSSTSEILLACLLYCWILSHSFWMNYSFKILLSSILDASVWVISTDHAHPSSFP
jgi:hypothetical protein